MSLLDHCVIVCCQQKRRSSENWVNSGKARSHSPLKGPKSGKSSHSFSVMKFYDASRGEGTKTSGAEVKGAKLGPTAEEKSHLPVLDLSCCTCLSCHFSYLSSMLIFFGTRKSDPSHFLSSSSDEMSEFFVFRLGVTRRRSGSLLTKRQRLSGRRHPRDVDEGRCDFCLGTRMSDWS